MKRRDGYAASGFTRGSGLSTKAGCGFSCRKAEYVLTIRERSTSTSNRSFDPSRALLHRFKGLYSQVDQYSRSISYKGQNELKILPACFTKLRARAIFYNIQFRRIRRNMRGKFEKQVFQTAPFVCRP